MTAWASLQIYLHWMSSVILLLSYSVLWYLSEGNSCPVIPTINYLVSSATFVDSLFTSFPRTDTGELHYWPTYTWSLMLTTITLSPANEKLLHHTKNFYFTLDQLNFGRSMWWVSSMLFFGFVLNTIWKSKYINKSIYLLILQNTPAGKLWIIFQRLHWHTPNIYSCVHYFFSSLGFYWMLHYYSVALRVSLERSVAFTLTCFL